jgi:hypothetical protein
MPISINIPKAYLISLSCTGFFCAPCLGQNVDSIPKSRFKLGGYADTYYAYYSDNVKAGKFEAFPAISPRSNAFGLNIAELTGEYTSDKVRAIITAQAGDLPTEAWSKTFNYIQEANVGARLSKTLWLDAGFFKTHIGTEALLPKDNIVSSVSTITYYEPWWQSGIRLVYTPSDALTSALYVVNGYNAFVPINKKKAVGLAVSYNLTDKLSFAYYNFISDNTPDNIKTSHWRFLNNLVCNFKLSKKFIGVVGMDYILQENSDITNSPAFANNGNTAYVYSLIFTLKYQFNFKWDCYGRIDYFRDTQGILSGVYVNENGDNTGYVIGGGTMGLECKPSANSYIRIEGKGIQMENEMDVFDVGGKHTNTRLDVMLDMGIWF